MNLDQMIESPQSQLPQATNNITKENETQVVKENTVPPPEEVDEFDKFVVDKVQLVTETILSNCAEDRAKATDIITQIEKTLSEQGKVIQGGTIARLLQAIQTRADINSTAVKMMEACGKILSARKGGAKTTITNNNQPTSTSNTLISLLQEGIDAMGDK